MDPFYKAKLMAARFYFQRLLPETAALIRSVAAGSDDADGTSCRGVLKPADKDNRLNRRKSMSNFIVRKVAVLGAGVMGAQIAAHCVNARVPVVLFDLPAKEGPKNGIVLQRDREPEEAQPGAARQQGRRCSTSRPPTTKTNLELLRGCDLVIEAIAERMDWKHDLYKKVAPFVARRCDLRLQHVGPVDHEALRGDSTPG